MQTHDNAGWAKAIDKTYPGNIHALQNISLEIPFGQITTLIGSNGSGKTTLLRILAGVLKQDAGTIEVLAQNPWDQTKSLRTSIGYIPQQKALDPEMTGEETLHLFATLYDQPKTRIKELANQFGLTDCLSRRISTYSEGLRQRIHLALGIIHKPKTLFLDEPTTGLDPQGSDFVWRLLNSYAGQGHAILLVTHNLDNAARYSTRIALLHKGKLLMCMSPRAIVSKHGSPPYQKECPDLSSAYFNLTGCELADRKRLTSERQRSKVEDGI